MLFVKVDAFSSGRMRRGLTMTYDLDLKAQVKALETKSDAKGVKGSSSLIVHCFALDRVLIAVVAQAKPLEWVRMSQVSASYVCWCIFRARAQHRASLSIIR